MTDKSAGQLNAPRWTNIYTRSSIFTTHADIYKGCDSIELATQPYKPPTNPTEVIYPHLSSLKQPYHEEKLAHQCMMFCYGSVFVWRSETDEERE